MMHGQTKIKFTMPSIIILHYGTTVAYAVRRWPKSS